MYLLRISMFAIGVFLSGTASASSVQLARCVNVNAKAAEVMKGAGVMNQYENFRKYADVYTAFGRGQYGASRFNSDLAGSKRQADAMSNEELVKVLPGCIELANSLNAQQAQSAGRPQELVAIPFKVVNRSSQPIEYVYASPSDATSWGKDLLGEQSIRVGEELFVPPAASKVCIQDVRVVFKDKTEYETTKKDLCQAQTFTLNDNSRVQKAAAQGSGQAAARTYCAVSDLGGPPVGCGLSLAQCQQVVRGLAGMMCR